jgi:hypothetical protein
MLYLVSTLLRRGIFARSQAPNPVRRNNVAFVGRNSGLPRIAPNDYDNKTDMPYLFGCNIFENWVIDKP